MLTDENIIDLNNILNACEALKLTDSEIRYLNYSNANIIDDCDLYYWNQKVLLNRSKNITGEYEPLNLIVILANNQNCNNIKYETIEKKGTNIAIMAGGI